VLAIIERMMVEHLPRVVPSSLLGKTLQYMRGQWHKLIRYVENENWPTRTIGRVSTEMSLQVLAYNLKRVMNILGTARTRESRCIVACGLLAVDLSCITKSQQGPSEPSFPPFSSPSSSTQRKQFPHSLIWRPHGLPC